MTHREPVPKWLQAHARGLGLPIEDLVELQTAAELRGCRFRVLADAIERLAPHSGPIPAVTTWPSWLRTRTLETGSLRADGMETFVILLMQAAEQNAIASAAHTILQHRTDAASRASDDRLIALAKSERPKKKARHARA